MSHTSTNRPELTKGHTDDMLGMIAFGAVAVAAVLGLRTGYSDLMHLRHTELKQERLDHLIESIDAVSLYKQGKISSSDAMIIKADGNYETASDFAAHLGATHHLRGKDFRPIMEEVYGQLPQNAEHVALTGVEEGQEFVVRRDLYVADPNQR